jgi:hypothetical protein
VRNRGPQHVQLAPNGARRRRVPLPGVLADAAGESVSGVSARRRDVELAHRQQIEVPFELIDRILLTLPIGDGFAVFLHVLCQTCRNEQSAIFYMPDTGERPVDEESREASFRFFRVSRAK